MALFGRRKKKPSARTQPAEDQGGPERAGTDEARVASVRSGLGPQDSGGQPAPENYIDLGALHVPRVPGLQLRGSFEGDNKVLNRMLLVLGSSGVGVSIAAAPKSGGAWPELAEQIETAITAAGGESERTQGKYGMELQVKVASALPDGSKGLSPLRIIGVEGPRWLARLDIQGAAAAGDAEQTEAVEELIDALIVNRGPEPRIRFELLKMQLPKEAADAAGMQG